VVEVIDFSRGRPTHVIGRDLTPAQRDEAVARAQSRIGEWGYSLGGWNCEHFATWCVTGVAFSQQVADVIAYLIGLLKALVAGVFVRLTLQAFAE
jgi:hypothetical protein